MDRVDAVILGSGLGGVPLAVDLARDGKRVTLFERGRLGGSCVNYGCTPSKAFLGAARACTSCMPPPLSQESARFTRTASPCRARPP